MKLTTRGYYSLKAMLDLALLDPGQLASVRVIAERQQIPAPYLEKLLIELRQGGLVRSQRGIQGGYCLNHLARDISLASILAAVGEKLDPPNFGVDQDPNVAEDRVMQAVWRRVSRQVNQVLQETTLEDLYFDTRSWQAAQSDPVGGGGFVV